MSLFNWVKVTISFTVQEELFPGLFYNPEDFAESTCNDIKMRLSAYKPIIEESDVTMLIDEDK